MNSKGAANNGINNQSIIFEDLNRYATPKYSLAFSFWIPFSSVVTTKRKHVRNPTGLSEKSGTQSGQPYEPRRP